MAPVEKILSEKTENVPDNGAPVKEAAPEAIIKEPFKNLLHNKIC